jgi:hypothetical protein
MERLTDIHVLAANSLSTKRPPLDEALSVYTFETSSSDSQDYQLLVHNTKRSMGCNAIQIVCEKRVDKILV